MDRRIGIGAASRDAHLALRRVERQQAIIERLYALRGERVSIARLAAELAVAPRTIQRDVERLMDAGIPLRTHAGRHGGVSLDRSGGVAPVAFDLPELAAVMSSLAVLGPTVSPSASSAMRKLIEALDRRPVPPWRPRS